jgi:hypothetical protein
MEERGLRSLLASYSAFPTPHSPCRSPGRSRPLRGGRWRTQTIHANTDLSFDQTSPVQLADAVREHWGIRAPSHRPLVPI